MIGLVYIFCSFNNEINCCNQIEPPPAPPALCAPAVPCASCAPCATGAAVTSATPAAAPVARAAPTNRVQASPVGYRNSRRRLFR